MRYRLSPFCGSNYSFLLRFMFSQSSELWPFSPVKAVKHKRIFKRWEKENNSLHRQKDKVADDFM